MILGVKRRILCCIATQGRPDKRRSLQRVTAYFHHEAQAKLGTTHCAGCRRTCPRSSPRYQVDRSTLTATTDGRSLPLAIGGSWTRPCDDYISEGMEGTARGQHESGLGKLHRYCASATGSGEQHEGTSLRAASACVARGRLVPCHSQRFGWTVTDPGSCGTVGG